MATHFTDAERWQSIQPFEVLGIKQTMDTADDLQKWMAQIVHSRHVITNAANKSVRGQAAEMCQRLGMNVRLDQILS